MNTPHQNARIAASETCSARWLYRSYKPSGYLTSDEAIKEGIIGIYVCRGRAAVQVTHGAVQAIACRIYEISVYFARMEIQLMQELPEFRAADLTRRTSDLFDAAVRSPIAITKHRKPKFVLMSMDQYQQLARRATQQAHMIDEMPEDLRALMIEGLERDLTETDE